MCTSAGSLEVLCFLVAYLWLGSLPSLLFFALLGFRFLYGSSFPVPRILVQLCVSARAYKPKKVVAVVVVGVAVVVAVTFVIVVVVAVVDAFVVV